MHHPDDAEAVTVYGEDQPEYGGAYYQGDQLIVLFTRDLDRHREALAARVKYPERITVRRATGTWTQIEGANRLLQARLLTGSTPVPGVNGVGIGMSEDDFVIHVGVDQYDEDVVAAIGAAALTRPLSWSLRSGVPAAADPVEPLRGCEREGGMASYVGSSRAKCADGQLAG